MKTVDTTIDLRQGPCQRCGAETIRPVSTGFGADWLNSLPLTCDTCHAELDEQDRLVAEARDKAERDERFRRRILASGLPPAHHSVQIEDLDHSEHIITAAARWAAEGDGLLLTGDVGAGKTTVAGAAVLRMLRSRPVLWTSAPLLFARLGSGFGSSQRDWALDVLTSPMALVLDDLDKARPSEFAAEQVFLAIDQRTAHRAPLLITTNLTLDELAGKFPDPYGDSIASRIAGYCHAVQMTGPDRRLEVHG